METFDSMIYDPRQIAFVWNREELGVDEPEL